MFGSPTDPGIVPRVCGAIFEAIGEVDTKTLGPFTVKASYLQLYCEVLHDLLSGSSLDKAQDASRDQKKDLKIRRGVDGIYAENVSPSPVDLIRACLLLFPLSQVSTLRTSPRSPSPPLTASRRSLISATSGARRARR